MPAHQDRVRRAGLPKDYQFGDAGRRSTIKVSRATFYALVDLALRDIVTYSRYTFRQQDDFVRGLSVCGTVFEPED
jgi:hypothetical protein